MTHGSVLGSVLGRPAVAAAMLLLSWVGVPSRGAAAETLRANYGVHFAGLPVGEAGLVGVLDDKSYRLDITAKLTGLAGMITSFRGAGSASGRMAGQHLLPAAYATATANPDGSRTIRMSMAAGAVAGVNISPPIDERPDRIPLRPGDKRGIVDPMSALLMPVAGAAPVLSAAGCNRTLPIFDGYSRYNITLSYVRAQTVQVRGYAGPVLVCAARYVPIAGHRNRRAVQYMADNRDLQVWLAPLGSSRWLFPFKIVIRTQAGETEIEASDFVVSDARSAAVRQ